MFDDPFLPATPRQDASAGDGDAFREAEIAVQAVRDVALLKAQALAKRYSERRTMLQETDGGEFIGIFLDVRARSEGRSISLEWKLGHYRNGQFVGSTNISKPRGSAGYDIARLKRRSPEWAHALVIETEMEARQIREALLRLTEADTALRVARRRLTNEPDGPLADHASD